MGELLLCQYCQAQIDELVRKKVKSVAPTGAKKGTVIAFCCPKCDAIFSAIPDLEREIRNAANNVVSKLR